MNHEKKVAIITGSSTGIGYETSLYMARNGFKTYATMRNLEKAKGLMEIKDNEKLPIEIIKLDVNCDDSVNESIKKIIDQNDRIDVLVNNAGYDVAGALEELTLTEFKAQFETNFFGVIRVIKEVVPIMRKQNHGTIVNISSIGGKVGVPLNSAYIASKFALEGLSDSIRFELQEFGINIILIEPGVVRSNFFENVSMATNASPHSPYYELTQKVFSGFVPLMGDTSSSPKQVAETILEAVTTNNPQIRYVVGKDAISILENRKKLSDRDFEKWMMESLVDQKGFVR
ncbi:MAG TPA: SDR family oxidoreductase [Nitrososphaeraceae archaeon]|nr:SDR family oxidoreductase [Nitrososphaeraceae archaeon]